MAVYWHSATNYQMQENIKTRKLARICQLTDTIIQKSHTDR